jgi:tetratricopeptide (TPR) repeat protein
MKTLILVLLGMGVAASATLVAVKWQTQPRSAANTVAPPLLTAAPRGSDSSVSAEAPAPETPPLDASDVKPVKPVDAAVSAPANAVAPGSSASKLSVAAGFSPLLRTLVSPQATYAQKKAAWKELRDSQQLDKAIADLEQAVRADPSTAEYPTALAEGYLQKLTTIDDAREKSVLAIRADQSFDQALKVDPTNWEARFVKSVALSYWPESLNKSGEVIDNLVTLMEQQESRSPQPHFVQTYVLLGDQYLKVGYTDDARETYRRGASMFPGDSTLREKLANLQ